MTEPTWTLVGAASAAGFKAGFDATASAVLEAGFSRAARAILETGLDTATGATLWPACTLAGDLLSLALAATRVRGILTLWKLTWAVAGTLAAARAGGSACWWLAGRCTARAGTA